MIAPAHHADADLRRCIHCGLCLEACPTFPLGGREGDAPRGRIQLLRAFAEGTLFPHADSLDPIRTCLGCGSCEPACPSGVEYLKILGAGRARLHRSIDAPLPPATRLAKDLLLRALASPLALRALGVVLKAAASLGLIDLLRRSGIPQEIGGILPTLVAMLPGSDDAKRAPRESGRGFAEGRATGNERAAGTRLRPPRVPAVPRGERIPVDLFRGCMAPILLPDVEPAARGLLAEAGYEVSLPKGQGCCGALAWHYGDPAIARACLRRNIRAFAGGSAPIVVTAAGCGAALREAPQWLEEDDPLRGAARDLAARVKDLTEILDESERWAPINRCDRTVVFQDPCHLKQVQGITEPPRRLLRRIPGLELREPFDAQNCCGSAGLYSFLHPEISRRLATEMIENLAPAPVSWIVTANPGCLLHLRQQAKNSGREVTVLHIAEALAMAIADSLETGDSGRCH
jgi:glycolate oxidase iron-sulfur subunit